MFKFIEKIPPLARVPLRYGLIAGFLGFLLVVSLYYIDPHPLLIPPFLDFRILLLGVFFFFSLKELRHYFLGDLLFFWQGMIACFVLTASFATVATALIYLFSEWETSFVTDYIRMANEQVRQYPPEEIERIGKELYEATLSNLQNADSYFIARRYVAQSFVIGFFVSIIISVILRRQAQY